MSIICRPRAVRRRPTSPATGRARRRRRPPRRWGTARRFTRSACRLRAAPYVLCACAGEGRTPVGMSWWLRDMLAITSARSSSTTSAAVSGAILTQIGMCVCAALRIVCEMRSSDVGMSCSYNAYVCLNAQKLLNSYTNTYEPVTMKPTSDMMHNLPIPSTNVCKKTLSLRAGQTGLRRASGAAARVRSRRECRCRAPRHSMLSRSPSPPLWRGRAADGAEDRTDRHSIV